MIHTGDQPASLYIGTAPVKEAYLGTTKVYPNREPVITVEYSAWTTRSLSLSASGSQIPATGGSISISATAHQTRTKTTLSDGVPIATEQETQSVSVVPALSSNNGAFRVSGTTVSCDHRHAVEGDRLSATITGSYGGASATLTLYQQENKPVSYRYRIEVYRVDGAAPADPGGYHTAYIRTQQVTKYTSNTEGEWTTIPGPASAVSVKSSNSVFSSAVNLPSHVPDIGDYEILTFVSANSSTSARSATITVSWNGVTAQYTATQAGITITYDFRYNYSNKASKYPRFAVNGVPGGELLSRAIGLGTPIHMLSYKGAIKKERGLTTSYLDGEPSIAHVGDAGAYVGAGYNAGWNDSCALGFISLQQGNFMNNYPYKYVTLSFSVKGSEFTLSGIVLFEKNYGDFEAAGYTWYTQADTSAPYALAAFSEAETRAVRMLAANGSVTEEDVPGMTLEDFETLSAKINAARRPDTNRYEQSEDGSWRVIPAGETAQ